MDTSVYTSIDSSVDTSVDASCIIYILAQSRVALQELLLKNDVASQLVV